MQKTMKCNKCGANRLQDHSAGDACDFPEPLPHVVVGDDEHGYGIEQCGVLMPDEHHTTREAAEEVANLFNQESE